MAYSYNGLNPKERKKVRTTKKGNYYGGGGFFGGIGGSFAGMGGAGGMGYGQAIGQTAMAFGRAPVKEVAGVKMKRGMYDAADPLYYAANGNESTVGNVFSDVGVNLFEQSAQKGNLFGMAAGGLTKATGSLINAMFGTGVDEKKLAAARAGTNALKNFNSTARSFDDIQGPAAQANVQNAYSSGWFRGGWASRRNRRLRQERAEADKWANRAIDNNINNIMGNQISEGLANYTAFGGPLQQVPFQPMTGGAITYNFMSDYLTMKNRQVDTKNSNAFNYPTWGGVSNNVFADGGGIHIKHPGRLTELKKRTGKTEAELWAEGRPDVRKMITFARNARKWNKALGGYLDARDNLLAFGGDLQTNGSDFPSGLTHIGAGLSHEENPYGGVQMGVDKQNIPNYVEQNEVIWDDYVFSDRIPCDEETKKKFHINKKRDITYADLAKKLEKEITERPEDPISKAGFKAQMEDLQECQERQKQEMEAERAKAAFEALPPEEQVAMMNRANQEEQMAQAAMQEQAIAEQQAAMEQPKVSPEEAAMAEQQMMQQASEAPMEAPQMAEGGPLYNTGTEALNPTSVYKDPITGDWVVTQNAPQNSNSTGSAIPTVLNYINNNRERREQERVNEWLDKVEEWLDDNPRNGRTKIHYYADGGDTRDEEWYNRLAPDYKWLADTFGINNLVGMQNLPRTFYDNLPLLYRRMLKLKDNPDYADFSLASANSNGFLKDDDLFNSIRNRELDSFKFADVTPEQWKEVLDDYISRHADTAPAINNEEEIQQGKKISLKDRIDSLIDRISERRAARRERRAARKEERNLTREERRTARLEEKEQERLEKENIHRLKAIAKEEEAREKALRKQERQDRRNGMRAANAVMDERRRPASVEPDVLPNNGQAVTPVNAIATTPQVTTVTDDSLRLNPDYYNNGKRTEMPEVSVTPNSDSEFIMNESELETPVKPLEIPGGGSYMDDMSNGFPGVDDPNHFYPDYSVPEPKSASVTPMNIQVEPLTSVQQPTKSLEDIAPEPIQTVIKPVGTPVMPDSNDTDATRADMAEWAMSKEGQETVEALKKKQEKQKGSTSPEFKVNPLRYAGLLGPAVSLGMMAAGVGKPDYSRLDAAVEGMGEAATADWKPIGNYLTYRPMDIWYEQNRLNANARATDRAVMNNASPIGTKMAGLLANGYNNQIASGNLYRQALEYNDAQKARVEDFNRGTNQFNAQAFNQNSQFNANAYNAHKQAKARLGLNAAAQRLDSDAGWYNSLYGNVNNLFKGVGNLGTDLTYDDWIRELVKSGMFHTNAKGGKIRKKRKSGLTY